MLERVREVVGDELQKFFEAQNPEQAEDLYRNVTLKGGRLQRKNMTQALLNYQRVANKVRGWHQGREGVDAAAQVSGVVVGCDEMSSEEEEADSEEDDDEDESEEEE